MAVTFVQATGSISDQVISFIKKISNNECFNIPICYINGKNPSIYNINFMDSIKQFVFYSIIMKKQS